jgi:MTH538 TIR-like domain (DUF1863)
MKGWKQAHHIDFDFRGSRDIDGMTASAENERYIKSKLRPRMDQCSVVVVLVGSSTRWLYKYVQWELELALQMDLPIIVVSLAEKNQIDSGSMPPIIRDKCIIQVPFKMKAIKYALDDWPSTYHSLQPAERAAGPRHYHNSVYRSFGL